MSEPFDAETLAAQRADAYRMEAEAMADPDAPLPSDTRISYPNRSRTFTMRLRQSEYEEIERIADERHLPASTLARAWLLDKLAAERRAS